MALTLAASAYASGAAEARYEGGPIPAGHHIEGEPRLDLVIAGAGAFVFPYGLGVGFAAEADFPNQTGWLVVPVGGPFLTLATRDGCHADESCVGEKLLTAALVTDGLVQALGVATLTLGLVLERKVLVPDESAWRVAPSRVGTGHGVVAIKRF
ncbi:MAG: hypothetical protein HYZ29_11965 [Myxococcales bacterium]|nr:hypothetical protein [Myxococcales bacterium]